MSKRNIRIVTSDTESYSSAKEDKSGNKENVAGKKESKSRRAINRNLRETRKEFIKLRIQIEFLKDRMSKTIVT